MSGPAGLSDAKWTHQVQSLDATSEHADGKDCPEHGEQGDEADPDQGERGA